MKAHTSASTRSGEKPAVLRSKSVVKRAADHQRQGTALREEEAGFEHCVCLPPQTSR